MPQPASKRLVTEDRYLADVGLRPNTIIAAGDSIAEGNYVTAAGSPSVALYTNHGYLSWANVLSGHRLRVIRNAGIGGNNSDQLRARFQADVLDYNPGYVDLMIGTNDVRGSMSMSNLKANWTWFYEQCRANGIHLFQHTIPPCGEAAESSTKKNNRADANNWLRSRARSLPGFTLIDDFPLLTNPSTGSTVDGLFDTPLIHPAAGGAAAMGFRMAEAIRTVVPPLELLPGSNVDDTNFLSNGMLTGSQTDINGNANVPLNCYVGGSATKTVTQVASDDRLQRQIIRIANSGAGSQQLSNVTTATSKWTTGDQVIARQEFRVNAVTSFKGIELRLKVYAADGTTLLWQGHDLGNAYDQTYASGSYTQYVVPLTIAQAMVGNWYVLETPPITLPANVGKIETGAYANGQVTMDWGRTWVGKVTS